ncbi:TetR family transcriptional regulator [Lysobacter helvus]|uniref:TetR family transcriptional regulator n=2 Tax=Lysobacteraceae TaxID=32033 RepID=A0ABN6FUS0_9GAMM|nr:MULTISPECIES: TetR/AcrR family transcriptional regulator [Lysobacter]BCT93189.1 TetR family transcriptional regulator [Lysobacter caseinilyticus]BCT96341.1 TetR family transcriptional regulator [Lysobacter helvus]
MTARSGTRRGLVVSCAYDLARVAGLEGITIGRVATLSCISKSGLLAHFNTREGLQIAVLDFATELFLHSVMTTANRTERGRPRLRAMMQQWFECLRDAGPACVLLAATCEYDGRTGPQRDLLVRYQQRWRAEVVSAIDLARQMDELSPGEESAQVAFELCAIAIALHHQASALGYDAARLRADISLERLLSTLSLHA